MSQTIKSPLKWLEDYEKMDRVAFKDKTCHHRSEADMTVYLDMDGVIADFFDGFANVWKRSLEDD